MAQFNERLKNLRKAKDLTQEQMAEYIGISAQAVSRWECGATCPDIFVLPQIAELLCITVDELLGIDENKKCREIDAIIADSEGDIDNGIIEAPIIKLRVALDKYPNNDRLLCSLMYGLYAACEEPTFCQAHDAEIISIAYRIQQYSTDDKCRNEARRLLFRHYSDTNRKTEALKIADGLAHIETCFELNIYWALDGEDRISYLKERISNDLRQLAWDIEAYSTHGGFDANKKASLTDLRAQLAKIVREQVE